MNGRSTLIALLCACLLGGFWYFYEFKGKEKRDKLAQVSKRVFPELESRQPTELVLRALGAQEISLKNSGGEWLLLKPLVAQADKVPVRQMLAQLKDLKNEGEVAQKAPGLYLAEFGLEPPSGSITFKDESSTAQTLIFGGDNPSQQYTYCLVEGKPSIFMVSRYARLQMTKGVKDLRDKTVWGFEPGSVTKVRSNFGSGLAVEKDLKGQWRLTRPKKAVGSQEAIIQWLEQLKGFRIEEFVNENGSHPASYGLDDGHRLELSVANNPKPMVLIQGLPLKSGKGRYYKLAGRPLIFSMSDISGQALVKDSAELIKKDPEKK